MTYSYSGDRVLKSSPSSRRNTTPPKQIDEYVENNGVVLACGTCIKSRGQNATEVCPISCMSDCVEMVEWADKVVTF